LTVLITKTKARGCYGALIRYTIRTFWDCGGHYQVKQKGRDIRRIETKC